MGILDYGIVIAYFVLVFFVAFWVTRRERKEKSSSSYFLGGKNSSWFVIGASLFASNIGSEHLIGLSGSGARGDFVNGQFELLAALILILLGWVFVPYYLKSGVYTMPEFLEKRYNRGARNYLSVISILAYVLTKISVTIFAGALVFDQLLGVEFWTGAILVVVATGVYTIFGGLKAVVYTDLVQMFVLTAGAIAVTWFGLDALGGLDALTKSIDANAGEQAGNYFNLWRSNSDTNYPWTGILFGAPILGVWYWCTDQFIVQRVLSAKNQTEARRGTIFAGFLKLLPLFLFVFPGTIAFALHNTDGVLLLDSAGEISHDSALPAMVISYLPSGMKGLVAAGLLAALMSSLSSVFNSCSTLVTMDFYKLWKPDTAERKLVVVGQVTTAILVVTGLLWIPFMKSMMQDGGLFKYLQSIQAYISPPIAAVFLLGLFVKKINAKGALAALWTGFVLGIGRLVLEFLSTPPSDGSEAILDLGNGTFLSWVVGINFLHFALLLFSICSVVMIAVSYARQEGAKDVSDLVYSRKASTNKWGIVMRRDLALTIVLIISVIAIWFIFSPLGIA
ncbi:MAG: sodium:solute symporter [Flavobacteriales bacterium]|nr:sodium:solute symporter [Flavobacteriales bacterium]MDG2246379.1 sodium:solute symporter [Flavobacteriales bacterium]